MRPIKSVAILGMGALGCAFASEFIETGFDVYAVARDQRRQRLRDKGIIVNGKHYTINVIDPETMTHPVDFIIVAVKQHHLKTALPDLAAVVDDQTTIISVMNGLESEEMIAAMYGAEKVLYAISVGIDALRDGNSVTYTISSKIIYGEAQNAVPSPQVQRVADAFQRAKVSYDIPEDMLYMLWWKFMVNVGVNQASAVMRAPYGLFQSSPEAQGLMETAMHEVITLAQLEGVNLQTSDINKWYGFLNTLSPDGETSMLQDIKAKRKTEVELFAAKVMELGDKHNVATPVNDCLYQIIHVLEQQYLDV